MLGGQDIIGRTECVIMATLAVVIYSTSASFSSLQNRQTVSRSACSCWLCVFSRPLSSSKRTRLFHLVFFCPLKLFYCVLIAPSPASEFLSLFLPPLHTPSFPNFHCHCNVSLESKYTLGSASIHHSVNINSLPHWERGRGGLGSLQHGNHTLFEDIYSMS